jgi:hypothetical protein
VKEIKIKYTSIGLLACRESDLDRSIPPKWTEPFWGKMFRKMNLTVGKLNAKIVKSEFEVEMH